MDSTTNDDVRDVNENDAGAGAGAGAPSKPWYASTGVWGAVVTLLGSILALLKVQLDPQLLDDIRQWVLSLVTLVGGGVALWGRVRATRRIGKSSRGVTALRMILLGTCAVAISSSGCATTLDDAFAQADRATYDAVAPEYSAYVAADPKLDDEQRARRNRTVEIWRMRVEDEQRRAVSAPQTQPAQ